jgi:hypothetical protein
VGGMEIGWIVRLVKTDGNVRSLGSDVLEIDRPDDVGDVAQVGLTLAEGRMLLARVQNAVVTEQARAQAERRPLCQACHGPCHVKDYRPRLLATLFGYVTMRLARFRCAMCGRTETGISWPTHARSTPELDRWCAHFSALMSYRVAAATLSEPLPVGAGIRPETSRNHALKIGEQACETRADRPTTVASEITIALDSPFIRSCERDQIGKLETDGGTRQVIAAVTDGDTSTAALIHRCLERVCRCKHTKLTPFTDGCAGLRSTLVAAGVTETPTLDWFHIAMRLQHVTQAVQGLPTRDAAQVKAKELIAEETERLRWRLWHDKVTNTEATIDRIRTVMRAYRGEQHRRGKLPASRQLWGALGALFRRSTSMSPAKAPGLPTMANAIAEDSEWAP